MIKISNSLKKLKIVMVKYQMVFIFNYRHYWIIDKINHRYNLFFNDIIISILLLLNLKTRPAAIFIINILAFKLFTISNFFFISQDICNLSY